MFDTPILLITFNRPDHVRRVLGEIRKQQPNRLFVFQDGPRNWQAGLEKLILANGDVVRADDYDKIIAVRNVIKELIDWPCELRTLFQNRNYGCGPGPYTAISWFFSNVDYGIILEDDLDPHPFFFQYMADLLKKYKDVTNVGLVTAHNQKRIYANNNTYYFTFNMTGTLGWGSWARVWRNFDFNIKYDRLRFDEALKTYYNLPKPYRDYENKLYAKWMSEPRNDVWDHMFKYYLLLNGYLDAKPNCCLVSHLGTDKDATHTGYSDCGYMMEIRSELFNPIIHPKTISLDPYESNRVRIKSLKIIIKSLLRRLNIMKSF